MYKYALLSIVTLAIMAPSVTTAQGPATTKKSVPVIVAPVVKHDFADQIEALATTKANESVKLTADRSEKIAAIHFEDGQEVKKGALLVTLDKRQEEAELRASQALSAEKQNSYNRAKGLRGNSALPEATLQARLAELKKSQADTQAIKAGLESYEITAPFDGVLGLREVSVGTLVQPGDTITTIDDLSQIKVDFDVPSVFLNTLKLGLPVSGFIDAFGNREFIGVIRAINTQIDPITRTVKIRAILPNEDGLLKPGLLMRIVLSKELRQSLLIPEEALVKKSTQNYVFVVVSDNATHTVKLTEVEIGARQPGLVEILSGLNEGDLIVNHGVSKIRDGATISIRAHENIDTPLEGLLKQDQQPDRK